jgi:protein-tyrosine phosphatase
MKNKIKLQFLALLLCMPALAKPKETEKPKSHLKEASFNILRTRAGFHFTRFYTKIKEGADFTFHAIAHDFIDSNPAHDICVVYDAAGAISAIDDGKSTPLILSSIPYKQSHIDQLKQKFNPALKDKSISILTLNELWECKAAGLDKLVKNNQISQCMYPTPDLTAPTLIDLIRAVRDLENRDNYQQQLTLVHCKAGRGRSATVVAAYLIHVLHKIGQKTTVAEIEAYLVTHRPQVRLGKDQKKAVLNFYNQLKASGSFDKLYQKYKIAIKNRDQEIAMIQEL